MTRTSPRAPSRVEPKTGGPLTRRTRRRFRRHSELTNAVLINRDGADPQADATVELSRSALGGFVLGEIGLAELEQGGARTTGEAGLLSDLVDMLDHFPA